MTLKEFICYCILISLLVYLIGEKKKQEPPIHVLTEGQTVVVPQKFKKLIGYDSLQMIFIGGKWKVNFCYPNEYVLNQLKIDTTK